MKRIVFAAIVAFTDLPTNDGRILEDPGTTACPVWERVQYPLPVYSPWGQKIGEIELASIVDHRVTLFGHLSTDPEYREYVEELLDGSARMELDVMGGTHVFPPDEPMMRISGWGIFAVHVGHWPCWNLPPVQIEEFAREVIL